MLVMLSLPSQLNCSGQGIDPATRPHFQNQSKTTHQACQAGGRGLIPSIVPLALRWFSTLVCITVAPWHPLPRVSHPSPLALTFSTVLPHLVTQEGLDCVSC